jgi:putative intracellular protease/amidase
MTKIMKVLFVTTSHSTLGDTSNKTGVWLEELAAPYYVFKDAGAVVTLASPQGGPVPLDPKSQSIIIVTRTARQFLKDPEAMYFLAHATPLDEIKADDFDVVFLPGGHGALWDIAGNKALTQLLETFNNSGKPIGAIGHGVAGLLSMQNEQGELVVKGKRLTGFSDSEEKLTGLTDVVPFLLASKLLSLGALYSSGADYVSHLVADGNIITGQNPASSEEAAKRIVAWHNIIHQQNLLSKQGSVNSIA